MIKIFTGDDRIRAHKEIARELGDNYEVIEGPDLTPSDLPSITKGASLFDQTRHILIRDLSSNKPVYEQLPSYLDTPHQIIILESKLDKRSATYKALKGKISITEFALPKNFQYSLLAEIYRTSKRDGQRAVQLLSEVQQNEDPIKFCGALISEALKDYKSHQGITEKRVLRELSILDLQLKSTSYQPWLLIQSFLLRVSSL